ncbi:MAG: hypothetical protein GF341_04035 [candidate division Zixibacteria bacterium]|nr:hypothetical protein [candidate division Zixibacteria bacterium]
MSIRVGILVVVALLVAAAIVNAQLVDVDVTTDTSGVVDDTTSATSVDKDDSTIVYYFHGNKRCMTCRKIEALAEKAVLSGFDEELADSTLQWRVLNFQDDENAHFAKSYKLFSQTLIVSRHVDGEEVAWRNLDQIWTLVHDEDAFISYVQDEVDALMTAEPE